MAESEAAAATRPAVAHQPALEHTDSNELLRRALEISLSESEAAAKVPSIGGKAASNVGSTTDGGDIDMGSKGRGDRGGNGGGDGGEGGAAVSAASVSGVPRGSHQASSSDVLTSQLASLYEAESVIAQENISQGQIPTSLFPGREQFIADAELAARLAAEEAAGAELKADEQLKRALEASLAESEAAAKVGMVKLLGEATAKGDVEAVHSLVKLGVDVNSELTYGLGITPLHIAVSRLRVTEANIIKHLFELKADPTRKTWMGLMPLHVAARSGRTDHVRELLVALKEAPHPIMEGVLHSTPLAGHCAARDEGCTPLDMALKRGHQLVVDMLRAAELEVRETQRLELHDGGNDGVDGAISLSMLELSGELHARAQPDTAVAEPAEQTLAPVAQNVSTVAAPLPVPETQLMTEQLQAALLLQGPDSALLLSATLDEARVAGVSQELLDMASEALERPASMAPVEGCQQYTFEELLVVTESFSVILGSGGFGAVFKGLDSSGRPVAVKRLDQESALGESAGLPSFEQWKNEVVVLSRFRHENVVPLLGWCAQGCELCLVYMLMEAGSLFERLAKIDDIEPLTVQERVVIVSDIACGLAYLHENGWVHRDVKSANVLLEGRPVSSGASTSRSSNSSLSARIGDFGIAKKLPTLKRLKGKESMRTRVMHTRNVIGTSAYLAPECLDGEISVKMDSFAYGLVLLEVLTGLPVELPSELPPPRTTAARNLRRLWDDELLDVPAQLSAWLDPRVGTWDAKVITQLHTDVLSRCLELNRKRRIDIVGLLPVMMAVRHQVVGYWHQVVP